MRSGTCYTATAVVLGAVLAVSCQKQNKKSLRAQPIHSQTTAGVAVSKPSPSPGFKRNARYLSSGWCRRDTPINCVILPEIVITAHVTQRLQEVAGINNPDSVASAFNSDLLLDVANELEIAQVDSLLSGRYYLKFSHESESGITFMAGSTSPVTETNFDFAFQYKK